MPWKNGIWEPDYTFGAGDDLQSRGISTPLGSTPRTPSMPSFPRLGPLSNTTTSSPFPWMQVGSGAAVAGGLLGMYATSKNAGRDAMAMSKKLYDLYSDPGSSYYRTAFKRLNQVFADASPTMDTIMGANASAGLGSRTSSVIWNQLMQAQTAKNRSAATGAVNDLWLQGQGNAMNALQMYNQAAMYSNESKGNFWDTLAGAGVQGLLGLLV